ncbi:MAG: TIGR03016 family PEP-CTERM system-associated outer membrane protein [Chromatiales bacterium]|nr:TIGR03016 family PEP-CTERM system-associated outer membrane protein [Chromatiales bacterium]
MPGRLLVLLASIALVSMAGMDTAMAAQVRITPSLTVEETYSDNIAATNDEDRRSAFVTSIIPGILVDKQSGRSSLSLAYRPELLIRHNTGSTDFLQRLFGSARSELVRDTFFLEGTASARQVSRTSQASIALDNVNESDNRETAYAAKITPSYRGHLGEFFDSFASLSLGRTHVSGGAASDATDTNLLASIRSGRYFRVFGWNLSVSDSRTIRGDSNDVVSTNINLGLNYRLTREFSLFSNMGYSRGDAGDVFERNDGFYGTVGVAWQPTPRFRTSVQAGINRYGYSFSWAPTNRTNIAFDYLNRDVGLNQGDRYSLALNHATRRSTWRLSYTEEVTTSQALLLVPILSIDDPLSDDQFSGFTLGFTDRVFLNKTLEANFAYALIRGRLELRMSNEIREFEGEDSSDELMRLSARYSHTLSRASRASVEVDYRSVDSGLTSSDQQEIITYRLGLRHALSSYVDTSLELSRSEGNRGRGIDDFSENRAVAKVSVRF